MAVNAVQTALSSRRFNRWLLVLGGLVLVAGIIAILATKVGSSGNTENANPTGPPIPAVVKAQPNIPFPKAAWQVAREFLFTAVARKDLAKSYAIAHPDLRGGLTLKQWETGQLPFVAYPTAKVYKYNWKNTNYAHPRDAQINVILTSSRAAGQRPIYAQVGLTKIGSGSDAHWTVSYFSPLAGPPIPTPK
jgi:hypothetical protein